MKRGLKIFKKYGAGVKTISEIAETLHQIIYGNHWNQDQFTQVIHLENKENESDEDCDQPEEKVCEGKKKRRKRKHLSDMYDPEKERSLLLNLMNDFN